MRTLLQEFALMCEKSRTLDGDRQKDGWGVVWFENDSWKIIKSLKPIWEDQARFKDVSDSTTLVAHTRSASFPETKNNVDYNEPYIYNNYCFVFNGLLKGVRVKKRIPGEIGAQKVWSLLRDSLERDSAEESLQNVQKILRNNAREIIGLNIGLSDGKNIFALCGKHTSSDYFTLRKIADDDLQIICSEEIGNYKFGRIKEGKVVVL